MAKSIPETLHKRSSKFESFLKKNGESIYENVRAYEQCIVCSERENKAFKFVVLTDEAVHLTENPPKTVQEAVNFKDVVDVELVHDFPDFLSGAERENTQHIAVRYLVRNKNRLKLDRKTQGQEHGRKSPRPQSFSDDTMINSLVSNRGNTPDIESDEEVLSRSMPSQLLHKLGISRSRSNSPRGAISPRGGESNDDLQSPTRAAPLSRENSQLSSTGSLDSEASNKIGDSKSRHSNLGADKGPVIVPRLRLPSDDTTADRSGDSNNHSSANQRQAVVHLYMLSTQSPMMTLVKTAWNNYQIRSLLLLDASFVERTSPSPRRAKIDGETMGVLFNELKQELLNPGNSIEKIVRLMIELKRAAEKNFVLKKHFWKSAELYSFIVKKLMQYIPRSPSGLDTDEGRSSRADELEFVIVLMETLSLMFRETETVPARFHCLKSNKGRAAHDLLTLLTCIPEVPKKYVPPSSKASILLKTSKSDQWKCKADAEITGLMKEFITNSACLLFELILITEQGHWGDREFTFFNICWIIETLHGNLKATNAYVEGVVERAMAFLAPSSRKELSPVETVTVFQLFYVLKTLSKYSPRIQSHIRQTYREEFKYYIQAPILVQKFPPLSPLTNWTVSIIEKLTSGVLQKPFTINA